jgi:hypothetical protein
MASSHPLFTGFTFWCMIKDQKVRTRAILLLWGLGGARTQWSASQGKSWEDALTPIATVATVRVFRDRIMCRVPGGAVPPPAAKCHMGCSQVEEFWSVYNHMMRPNEMGPSAGGSSADLHLFPEGVKPAWEDPANSEGGRICIRLRKALTTEAWERVVLSFVGGVFPSAKFEAETTGPDGKLLVGVVLSIRHHEDTLSLWVRSCEDLEKLGMLRDELCELLHAPLSVSPDLRLHDRRQVSPQLPLRPGQTDDTAGSVGGASADVESEDGHSESHARVAPSARGPPGMSSRRAGTSGIAAGPRRAHDNSRTRSGPEDGDRWSALRGDGPRNTPFGDRVDGSALPASAASTNVSSSSTTEGARGRGMSRRVVSGPSRAGEGGNVGRGRGGVSSWRDQPQSFGRGRGEGSTGGRGSVPGASDELEGWTVSRSSRPRAADEDGVTDFSKGHDGEGDAAKSRGYHSSSTTTSYASFGSRHGVGAPDTGVPTATTTTTTTATTTRSGPSDLQRRLQQARGGDRP